MNPIPIYDDTAPIACTIGSDEIAGRVEVVERMRASLERVERTDHGLRLHSPNEPAIEADVRHFADDEKRCCQFWGFAIDATDEHLTLRWEGPPATNDLLDQLYGYFDGDLPLTAITGIL